MRGLYGDPAKTSFTLSGNEIWEYDFFRMHSRPTNFIPYVSLIRLDTGGAVAGSIRRSNCTRSTVLVSGTISSMYPDLYFDDAARTGNRGAAEMLRDLRHVQSLLTPKDKS